MVLPKGDKGDKGDTGSTGPQGERGPQGVQGEAGPQGETGATGATGPANTLTIGTVEKGANASATITGTAPNQTLNLVLPKGDKGDPGATGSQGPQGVQGPQGPQGPAGATGAAGRDGYVQYTAGDGITISNNVISATGGGNNVPAEEENGDYTATIDNTGTNITATITNGETENQTSLDMYDGNFVVTADLSDHETGTKTSTLSLDASSGYISLSGYDDEGQALVSLDAGNSDSYGSIEVRATGIEINSDDGNGNAERIALDSENGIIILDAPYGVKNMGPVENQYDVTTKEYVDSMTGGYLLFPFPVTSGYLTLSGLAGFTTAQYNELNADLTECLNKNKKPAFIMGDKFIIYGNAVPSQSGGYMYLYGSYVLGDTLANATANNYLNIASTYKVRIDYTYSNDAITATSYLNYDNVTKFLCTTNTASYTPTSDYNPATKKYVDDSVGGAVLLHESDLTNLSSSDLNSLFQTLVDEVEAGKKSILINKSSSSGKNIYTYNNKSGNTYYFYNRTNGVDKSNGSSVSSIQYGGTRYLATTDGNGTVTSVTTNTDWYNFPKFLATDVNYGTPYTPVYNGSPATKKYVDDAVAGAGGGLTITKAPFDLTTSATSQDVITAFGDADTLGDIVDSVDDGKAVTVIDGTDGFSAPCGVEVSSDTTGTTLKLVYALGNSLHESVFYQLESTSEWSVTSATTASLASQSFVNERGPIYFSTDHATSSTTRGVAKKAIDDYDNGIRSFIYVIDSNDEYTGFYRVGYKSGTSYFFYGCLTTTIVESDNTKSTIKEVRPNLQANVSGSSVYSIQKSLSKTSLGTFLDTNTNYSTTYTPTYNGSPATRYYVDSAMTNTLSPIYSSSSTYAVGDYVLYKNQLYECNTAISTAEAWNSAHWTATTLNGSIPNIVTDGSEVKLNYKVDNKWVYAKRYSITSLDASVTIAHGLTNFTLIDWDAMTLYNGTWRKLNYSVTSAYYIIDVDSTSIKYNASATLSGGSGVVTLYYTKN